MPDPTLGALVFAHALGAAVWFGGIVAIAIVNRALRSRTDDLARRGTVRHIGRAAAPILWTALAVASASALALWQHRGYAPASARSNAPKVRSPDRRPLRVRPSYL